jgi:hypothetical protein
MTLLPSYTASNPHAAGMQVANLPGRSSLSTPWGRTARGAVVAWLPRDNLIQRGGGSAAKNHADLAQGAEDQHHASCDDIVRGPGTIETPS